MAEKVFEGLPEESFATLETTGETIKIKRGESGFYRLPNAYSTAEEFNELFNITKGQAEAMYVGSISGWHVPAANPAIYDEDGRVDDEKFKIHFPDIK